MSGDPRSAPKLVRDLMTVGVLTCSPDTPVVDLTRMLLEKDLEGMVVLDMEGHAVGVVTHTELVRAYGFGGAAERTVGEIMRADVPQLPPDIPLTAAAQVMQDQGDRIVFLMHHAGGIVYPAAMLSFKHLLRHIAMRDVDEIRDLGISADRQTPVEAYIEKRDNALTKNLPSDD